MNLHKKTLPLLLSGILLAMLVVSCVRYYRTPVKCYRAKNMNVYSYRKHHFVLKDNSVDTNVIYLYSYSGNDEYYHYYEAYHFFTNGQVMTYTFYKPVDTAQFSDINYGYTGYYHIENNIIHIQTLNINHFAIRYKGGGRLEQHYGSITDKGINMQMHDIRRSYNTTKLKIINGGMIRDNFFEKTNIRPRHYDPTW